MEVIQIVVLLFAVFAFSRALLRYKEGKITGKELFFWSIVWLAVIVVVVLPWTTTVLASMLGIRRGVDLMVYLGVLVLFYLVFRVYVKLEQVEQEITKVVREVAIKKKK